jgi:hypothetical protein
MHTGVRFSLVFALPAALCFGLAGACTDGTTPNCSGDAATFCNEGGDGGAQADTGSSVDTGSGQESGSGAETGTDAGTAADAEGGAGHDAGAADGDASRPQDARGQ